MLHQNLANKKARGDLSRGAITLADDLNMQVFCPTRQI
jgi:hypothetical protein